MKSTFFCIDGHTCGNPVRVVAGGAPRLEGANKVYGSRCLISEATANMGAADFDMREIDRVVVTGQSQPQTVYEIMGRKDALTPQQRLACERYAAGLSAYRARLWDARHAAFLAILQLRPGARAFVQWSTGPFDIMGFVLFF